MRKKEGKKGVRPPLPKATLRRIFLKHKVRRETRISENGLNRLGIILDELAGWIIREAEKLVSNEGKLTISSKHISDAVKIYFGRGE